MGLATSGVLQPGIEAIDNRQHRRRGDATIGDDGDEVDILADRGTGGRGHCHGQRLRRERSPS